MTHVSHSLALDYKHLHKILRNHRENHDSISKYHGPMLRKDILDVEIFEDQLLHVAQHSKCDRDELMLLMVMSCCYQDLETYIVTLCFAQGSKGYEDEMMFPGPNVIEQVLENLLTG
uniref:Uncharacterized protein n=1 Tax=Octopus bimaculoides TaxID=37653 RepID=A0A0L8IHH5_OCTBM